jgi:hypothetical protein
LSRKYFGGGVSMKSALSMKSSRLNGTLRVPASGSSGLLTRIELLGFSLGIIGDHDLDRIGGPRAGAARRLNSSRTACSSKRHLGQLGYFVIPIR